MSEHSSRLLRRSALVGAIFGSVVAGIASYLAVPEYGSFAVVELNPLVGGYSSGRQIDFMRSEEFLARVSREMNLPDRWKVSERQALAVLRENLAIHQIKKTALCKIIARHPEPGGARDLVHGVIAGHTRYFLELKAIEDRRKSQVLEADLQVTQDKIEILNTERQTLLAAPAAGSPPRSDEDTELRDRRIRSINDEIERLKLSRVAAIYGVHGCVLMQPQTLIVHDDPIVSESPISPNIGLNLNLGAISGAIAFALVALVLRGVRPRD